MVTELAPSPWRPHRERQKERHAKRDAVLVAAARLFARGGFHGTSLDDIARSLDVTKPTLYHYIDSKEEIFLACMRRGVDALNAGVDAARCSAPPGRQRLRATLQAYADVVTSDFGRCAERAAEEPLTDARRDDLHELRSHVHAVFAQAIDEAVRDGSIEPTDPALAARTVAGALGELARWHRADDGQAARRLRAAAAHCVEMLMEAVLGAPPGTSGGDAAAAPLSADTVTASDAAVRREVHFGERVVRCFAERPAHLVQMLIQAVHTHPDGPALVADGLRLTWRELHHAATKCAGGLAALGVRPGDRVAAYMGNRVEFVVVTLACAWMGAVLMPISARAGRAELEFSLADAEAVAIVCTEALSEHLPAPAAVPALLHRIIVDDAPAAARGGFAELMRSAPLDEPHLPAEEDLAVLLYTSGTTGRPKGAMLTHLNIVHSVIHFRQAMGLGPADRSLVAVPLTHVTGLVAQLYTFLHCGGCLVLMAQFKAADFARAAAAERITHAIMVPAMYNLCLLLPDLQAHDLSAWRVGAFGGAPMPPATIDGLAERLPGLTLMNAYGATETSSPATIMPTGQTASHRDSVGRPVACADLHVVDELGNELPRGQSGEIWIAGPMVVPGYWRNAAATASEFRGGYWRSGDIGSIDVDGYVRILDRKKDVINRGGYKIFCAVAEGALAEHPQVVEAAWVGVPCAVLGERVHAFVCVREPGDDTTAAALAAFCAARLSDYAVPETWTIGTEPLPRNANGKVTKRALRDSLVQPAEGRSAALLPNGPAGSASSASTSPLPSSPEPTRS